MKLLVLDVKGKPVDKVLVHVIVPGNYVSPRGQILNDPRSDNMGAGSSNPNVTFDEEIFKVTTDAGGQCIVYGIRGRDDLILGLGNDRRNLQRIEGVSFGPQHLSRKVVLEGK